MKMQIFFQISVNTNTNKKLILCLKSNKKRHKPNLPYSCNSAVDITPGAPKNILALSWGRHKLFIPYNNLECERRVVMKFHDSIEDALFWSITVTTCGAPDQVGLLLRKRFSSCFAKQTRTQLELGVSTFVFNV